MKLRWAIAGAVVLLVAWSAWQRWQVLSASPFPVGVDGYFYPIQLRSLMETGQLHYAASPLAFWLMLPLAWATDPITGAKLGAAIGGALIAIPMYGVGARLGGRGGGLVAAALATTSAGSAYLTIEFVKNGIGITVAVAALWAVLVAMDRARVPVAVVGRRFPMRPATTVAVAMVIAAALTHKMAAGMVVAVAAPAVLAEAIARGRLHGRRLIYVVLVIAVVAVVAVVLGIEAPRRFVSANDAAEVAGLVSSTAHWSLPALERPRLGVGHEAWIGVGLAAVAAFGLIAGTRAARSAPPEGGASRSIAGTRAARSAPPEGGASRSIAGTRAARSAPPEGGASRSIAGTRAARSAPPEGGASRSIAGRVRRGVVRFAVELAPGSRVAAWMLIGLALLIGLPWLAVDDAQGLGMRLRIVAFVPMALCGALAARAVLASLSVARRDQILAGVAVVIALVAAGAGPRTEGEVQTHPALASAVMSLDALVPDGDTVIVPERHIAFMVAWYARCDVALRPEAVPREHRLRLLPLAFTGADSPLDHALEDARREPLLDPPLGLHARHPDGLVLVPEGTWDWVLARLSDKARAYFAAWPTI